MRAAAYTAIGAAREVLTVREVDRPDPGPGQVRVRVQVSAVNPTDTKTRDGTTQRPFDGLRIPHQDGAGVIDAVGPGVDSGRVGERVWMVMAMAPHGLGTAQELVCLPERHVVRMPEEVSFELGASLGIPAVTASVALFGEGRLSGQNVLVAGGAGAVGHFAIQLAKRDGARVITTVSSAEKAELAQAAGADVVVNYRDTDAARAIRETAPDGIDRVVEVALHENLPLDLEVVKNGATIVTYAAAGEEPQIPVRRLMTANLSLKFLLLYNVGDEALTAAIRAVSSALEDGALTELTYHRFPLEETADAHNAVEGGAVGKVLIDVTR
jgi:NADPH:quinone reductase